MKMQTVVSAVMVVAASGLSPHVDAADRAGSGWYAGVNLGRAESEANKYFPIGDADLSATAWAAHGGYRFNAHFAVEATYADHGEYGYTEDCPPGFFCIPEEFPREVSTSAVRTDLALVGSVPLGRRFEAYAKAGIAYVNIETEVRPSLRTVRSVSSSGTDALYGVGLRVHSDAPWSLRLQWDRTSHSAQPEPVLGKREFDVTTWWLGAEYRFVPGRRQD